MRVKDSLERLNVRASKERGQNFLIDESVTEHIFSLGQITPESKVVEIGPGLGALTKKIADVVIPSVIEIEEKFCEALAQQYPTMHIVNTDVRQVKFADFGSGLIVYGNLPYSFSSEIIFHLIESRAVINRAVLLLQKEFVERMAASPGGKDYGTLSIGVQLFCDVELGTIVPGNSFHPPTKVSSRTVSLTFHPEGKYPVKDYVWLRKVIKSAFLQRRKKAINSIRSSGLLVGSDPLPRIQAAFVACGLDPNARGESFSITDFVGLADALYAARSQ